MSFGVSNRVVVRDNFGRFISEVEAASQKTAKELVQLGARTSRKMAPVGSHHDRRTIPLRQSIEWKMVSRTSGYWYSTARHALPQEMGARPHLIVGSPYLFFYWENERRWWVPGLFGTPDIVNHPGHGAQPFLRPAYEYVTRRAMSVARKHYPG